MSGYWKDPVNTKAAFKEGWFITGDLARRDEDGYYFFAGRCKNTIIRDGGNITPEEVEYVLNLHRQVKESIVVGVADAQYGQGVFAFIQPADPDEAPTVEDLTSYSRVKLAERKVPGYYFFVSSFQGEGIMDKINRKALEKKAAQLVEAGEAQVAG
jgi:acyl-CoA synthetase (AMP-forming)/AMP-acid ligase II